LHFALEMLRYNLGIGKLGESIAKKYLQDKGYKILEQNCRSKYGEIDLICRTGTIFKPATIVFVEVKTRIGERFGTPEDALNRDKRQRLTRNALAYSAYKSYQSYRIDAVCVVLDENKTVKRITHYENI